MYNLRLTFSTPRAASFSGNANAQAGSLDEMKDLRDALQGQIGCGKMSFVVVFNPDSFIDGFEEVVARETLVTEEVLKSSVIVFSIVKA